MTTKFVHKRIHEDARDTHIALAAHRSPARPSSQRRFGLIPICALTVCVLLLGSLGRNHGVAFFGRPVIEGTARIIEKTAPADTITNGVLLLEIQDRGNPIRVEACLPREHWEPLHVGDSIAVRYQIGRGAAGLRLCDVGRIPIYRTETVSSKS